MIVGVPKEIKTIEKRVAITPKEVDLLVKNNHKVLIETDAGKSSGYCNNDYISAGAYVCERAEDVWNNSDVILKVQGPQLSEFHYLRKGLKLFTFLYLETDPLLAARLIEQEITALAFETVEEAGVFPILGPMSEIAGKMAVQIGAHYLEESQGGAGIVLGGVTGTDKGTVTIIGGGNAGASAAKAAIGLGAQVTVFDINLLRLKELEEKFDGRIQTRMSQTYAIKEAVVQSDLVIGAVRVPGTRAPILVTEDMVKEMKRRSVIVDVDIDQGGVIETCWHEEEVSRDNLTFIKHNVIHCALENIPGLVPKTSTQALTNACMPYVMEIANKGLEEAIKENASLKKGVNLYKGFVANKNIAESLGYRYVDLDDVLTESAISFD